MRRTRLFLPWSLLAGLLVLAVTADGLKATALVLGKLRQSQTSTTTDIPSAGGDEATGTGTEQAADAEDNNTAPAKLLTGVPQKDYVLDPNLPRELNGYNLTEYPFYDRVPEEMDFKCDGLHDGFYASVEHKCQVYHHCLFGTRYDFLCANYTAFDQKTFICHFVSEVDCANSPKYFKRNEALYKAASTTTAAPPPSPPPPPPASAPTRRPQTQSGRRKRPYSRPRRPLYDYYYDEDYEEDTEYYDDEAVPASGKGGVGRRNRKRPRRPDDGAEDSVVEDTVPVDPKSLYDRPRVPPKIRRPVPLNERDKYDYGKDRPTLAPPPSTSSTTTTTTEEPTTSTRAKIEDDYYDEEEYIPPARSRPKNQDYYPPTAGGADRDIVRRPPMSGAGRPIRRRPAVGRRRPATDTLYDDYYDYDFEDELPRRPSRPHRKRPRQPERTYNSQRNAGRYDVEEEDDPIPAARPAYITSSGARVGFRKRPIQSDPVDDYRPTSQGSLGYKRTAGSRKQVPSRYADELDDDYYDDEIIEDERTYRRSRPSANSRVSYQQDEIPSAPARSSLSNKRPFTSPARPSGGSSSSRSSQISSKNFAPTAPEILEDYPVVKASPSQSPPKQRPEPEQSIPPRPAFRPKSTTTTFAPVIEETSQKSSNVQKPTFNEEDRQDIKNKEPLVDIPARVPPSSYGTFRSKIPQSERDSNSRNGNFKSRPNVGDTEPITGLASTVAPSAPAKEAYDEVPPTRIRPVKVLVKPVDRNPARIPDDVPEQQNLADINDHEYDVILNDALHPTLHPTRNIEQPQRPFLPKIKSNYVTRAVNYQLGDEATTTSGRGKTTYLQASASQTYITRTSLPLHDKIYDSTTGSSQRAYRPSSQYEEVRYREQEEVPRYQQRGNWNRRDNSGAYY